MDRRTFIASAVATAAVAPSLIAELGKEKPVKFDWARGRVSSPRITDASQAYHGDLIEIYDSVHTRPGERMYGYVRAVKEDKIIAVEVHPIYATPVVIDPRTTEVYLVGSVCPQ